VFGVFMGALIEELGVNLHEHLHGVVHHAMDSSVVHDSQTGCRPNKTKTNGFTYRFQCPLEFS
jgi:hypothetical protein